MDWILNCNRYIDMGKSLVTGGGRWGGHQTHCTSLFRFKFPPPQFSLNIRHDAGGEFELYMTRVSDV